MSSWVGRFIARKDHECDAKRSIYCVGLIDRTTEYLRETTAPWAYDEPELIGYDEDGYPITQIRRLEQHPDGGRRGWRHRLTCWACMKGTE